MGTGAGNLAIAEMRELLGSWVIAMRGQATPAETLGQYERSGRFWLDWCAANPPAAPDLSDAEAVRRWLASLHERGQAPGTLNVRHAALNAWSDWLLAEEGIETAMSKVGWAKLDERIPPYLTEAQQGQIIAACAGRHFLDVRDAALFSVMFDGLIRSDEACSMLADGDVSLREQVIRVRRGKGGKERYTAVSPATVARLDRYQRARRKHRLAGIPEYWIGQKGALRYRGLYGAFKRRCEIAGIEAYPHMLRAGGAVMWRRLGGSTEGLMTIAGWKSMQMVMLYCRAAETELALGEARRLHQKPPPKL